MSSSVSFNNDVDVYFQIAFKFVQKSNGEFVSDDILEKEIQNNLRDVDETQFDLNQITRVSTMNYTFSETLSNGQFFPLEIPVSNHATVLESSAGLTMEPPIIDDDEEDEDILGYIDRDIVLKDTSVLLSQYSVGYIRVHYRIVREDLDLTGYIDCIDTCREHLGLKKARDYKNNVRTDYAQNLWDDFCSVWNGYCATEIKETLQTVDHYFVTRCRGIEVETEDGTVAAVDVLSEQNTVSPDIRFEIKQKLLGINNISPLWKDYTDRYVSREFERNVATSRVELQLINWKNAFILRNDELSAVDTESGKKKFDKYFGDLLVGLEILLMLRTSLRLLEMRLDEQGNSLFGTQTSLLETIDPRQIQQFYKSVEYFDEWLTDVKGWRRINRHAGIRHYHSFLKMGIDEMRVKDWIETTDEKLDQMRETYYARSNKFEAINQTILAIIIAVLTVVLAVPVLLSVISFLLS